MKILIVEDEPLVRMGIKSVLLQCGEGIEIVGEAANGEAAAQLLSAEDFAVDLVLSDVKMPVMDGIELAKWMRDHCRGVSLVVLSGHDDYDYVREAFRFGAVDYILKYEISDQSVRELLKKIPIQFKEKNHSVSKSRLRQECLLEIIRGSVILPEKELQKVLYNCESLLTINDHLYIANIRFLDEIISSERKREVENVVSEYLKLGARYELVFDQEGYGIIADSESGNKESTMDEKTLMERLFQVRLTMEKYCNVAICIGLSSRGIISQAEQLRKEAEAAADKCFFVGTDRVVRYLDIITPQEQDYANIKELQGAVMHSIAYSDYTEIVRGFKKLDEYFRKKDFEIKFCKKIYSPLIDLLQLIVKNAREEFDMESIRSYEEINERAKELIAEVCDITINIDKNLTHVIKRCLDYIHRNYSDENLGLQKLGESLGYTSSYLSRLFKQETGRNVVDYINEVRIKSAKRMLLDSRVKAYNVSEAVGYNNYSYFCRVFKKITEMSPSEYIAEHQK